MNCILRRNILLLFLFFYNFSYSQFTIGLRGNETINRNIYISNFYGFGVYSSIKFKNKNIQPYLFLEKNHHRVNSIKADIRSKSTQVLYGAGAFYKCPKLSNKKLIFNILASFGYSNINSSVSGYYDNWEERPDNSHFLIDLGVNLKVKLFKSPLNLDVFGTTQYWIIEKSRNNLDFPYKNYFSLDKNLFWLKFGVGLSFEINS